MPDVSRVEYDAALKRVNARLNCVFICEGDCTCKRSTLAALGLDEPPTEEQGLTDRQYAASICCGDDPRNCDRYPVCPMRKHNKEDSDAK